MDVPEPRPRRRGFFLHVEPHSLDHIEHEAAEGIAIRPGGTTRKPTHAVRTTSLSTPREPNAKSRSGSSFRSSSETGSHRQARMSR